MVRVSPLYEGGDSEGVGDLPALPLAPPFIREGSPEQQTIFRELFSKAFPELEPEDTGNACANAQPQLSRVGSGKTEEFVQKRDI